MNTAVQKGLIVYSAVISTVALAIFLMGARSQPTRFDEISVHRLNVTEPDGTLRMVISNKDRLPPVIIKGKERPEMGEARPQAGMIFYNDEGTENGGLIFSGRKNDKGQIVDSGASLSFDRYGAGQTIQLAGVDDSENHFAGLAINDVGGQRVWAGRDRTGLASISLAGTDGKERIRLQVTGEGQASIVFLDAKGNVIQEVSPAK
jgi:hypothetical protein|nr:hypothetical protein [Luteibacter rhizovicinus]